MTEIEGRGSRQAGNRAQTMLPLPEVSASIPSKSAPSSEIIGSRCLERAVARSIGTQPSAIVVAPLRQALSGMRPADTDRNLLASLPPSVRSALRAIRTELRYPASGGITGGELVDYQPIMVPAPDRIEARALVKRAMAPIYEEEAKLELLRLRASTVSKREDEMDMKAVAAIYLGYLLDYPGDVVRWTCRYWAVSEKFWPSWCELHELLERAMRVRRALDRVLQ